MQAPCMARTRCAGLRSTPPWRGGRLCQTAQHRPTRCRAVGSHLRSVPRCSCGWQCRRCCACLECMRPGRECPRCHSISQLGRVYPLAMHHLGLLERPRPRVTPHHACAAAAAGVHAVIAVRADQPWLAGGVLPGRGRQRGGRAGRHVLVPTGQARRARGGGGAAARCTAGQAHERAGRQAGAAPGRRPHAQERRRGAAAAPLWPHTMCPPAGRLRRHAVSGGSRARGHVRKGSAPA